MEDGVRKVTRKGEEVTKGAGQEESEAMGCWEAGEGAGGGGRAMRWGAAGLQRAGTTGQE